MAGDFALPACFVFVLVTKMTEKNDLGTKKHAAAMMCIVVAGAVAMTIIDLIIQPPYAVKSAAKVVLFTGMPLLYSLFGNKDIDLKTLFKLGGGARGLIEALLWGAAVFGISYRDDVGSLRASVGCVCLLRADYRRLPVQLLQ